MAGEDPGFGNAPSYVSDVQFDHNVSPDEKAITITFSNFEVATIPGGTPVTSRTFTFVMPLKRMASGATLTGAVQGAGAVEKGTGATLLFRGRRCLPSVRPSV